MNLTAFILPTMLLVMLWWVYNEAKEANKVYNIVKFDGRVVATVEGLGAARVERDYQETVLNQELFIEPVKEV